jgi:ABC-type transport system substrate-binding protein
MDSASWSDRYYGKGSADSESQMSMIGGDGGPAAGGYGATSLHSKNAYPKGGNGWNGFHWANPAMDAALDKIPVAFDDAERTKAIQDVCKLDSEEQTYIHLWATTRYWLVNNRIGNFVNTPGPGMGNYYKAAEMWYIRS